MRAVIATVCGATVAGHDRLVPTQTASGTAGRLFEPAKQAGNQRPPGREALRLLRSRHLVLLASLREGIVAELLAQPLINGDAAIDVASAHLYEQSRRDAFDRLATPMPSWSTPNRHVSGSNWSIATTR